MPQVAEPSREPRPCSRPPFRTPKTNGTSATSSRGCRTAISRRILKPVGRRRRRPGRPVERRRSPDIGSDSRANRRGKRIFAATVASPETACRYPLDNPSDLPSPILRLPTTRSRPRDWPIADHPGHQLRRMLQVSVHHDRPRPAGMARSPAPPRRSDPPGLALRRDESTARPSGVPANIRMTSAVPSVLSSTNSTSATASPMPDASRASNGSTLAASLRVGTITVNQAARPGGSVVISSGTTAFRAAGGPHRAWGQMIGQFGRTEVLGHANAPKPVGQAIAVRSLASAEYDTIIGPPRTNGS